MARTRNTLVWVGGKSQLAPILNKQIPPHKTYVESFGGGGGFLFRKPKSKYEIFNDLDGDLINFWRVVKEQHEELIRSFDYVLVSRRTYDEYKEKFNTGNYTSDLERAHIYFYLNQAGFGGDMKNVTFGISKYAYSRLDTEAIPNQIERAYERLYRVTIENKDYTDIFRLYDYKDAFFYLDPPYRKTKSYRIGKFTDDDYTRLRDMCRDMKGKFMLTLNDDPFIRELFTEFRIVECGTWYRVCKTNHDKYQQELIIMNY